MRAPRLSAGRWADEIETPNCARTTVLCAGGIVRGMAPALPLPPPGFDALPVDEQIEYVQSLWDRIAASVDQVPLQQWQQAILEERLAAHRRAPEDSQPWEDVIDRLQHRLRSGR